MCVKTNTNLICIILRCLTQGEFEVCCGWEFIRSRLYEFYKFSSTGREKQFSCDQWACNWQIKITLLNNFRFQSRYLAVQVEIWKSSSYNQYNPWTPDLKKDEISSPPKTSLGFLSMKFYVRNSWKNRLSHHKKKFLQWSLLLNRFNF